MINSHQNFVCLVIVSIFLIVYSSAKILSNENRDNTFVLQKAQVRYSEAAFNIIYAECKTNYINFFHFLSLLRLGNGCSLSLVSPVPRMKL